MSEATARLTRSRQAIIEEMAPPPPRSEPGEPAGWFARLRSAAGAWWRRSPAGLAMELATPVVAKYAGRNPWQFLAVAAAGGALLTLVRPWRVLSLSGVLLAVAKSKQLSALLASALAGVVRRD